MLVRSIKRISSLVFAGAIGLLPFSNYHAQKLTPASDLRWERANPYGKQIDAASDAWHAGRVTDVLVTKSGTLLVGTEAGGVWDIADDKTAISLSNDWDNPDVTCLAQGPNGNDHVYAGCGEDDIPTAGGALYETDLTRQAPLAAPWRKIPLLVGGKDIMGSVYKVVTSNTGPFIVLACSGGLFWAAVPKPGGDYLWQEADGVPSTWFYGLALSSRDTIVAAQWNASSSGTPIYYGTWQYSPGGSPVSLAMTPARISGVDPTQMNRTSLAVCDGQPNMVYALAASPRAPATPPCVSPFCGNTPLVVLRSMKRGKKWVATAGAVDGLPDSAKPWFITNPRITGDALSGGNIHHITVSRSDPNVVAFGWLHWFVSTNGGDNWTLIPATNPHLHDDVHKIYVDPRDDTGHTVYIASDGGLAGTTDNGKTFISTFNEKLATLEFYSTFPVRNFYGRFCASSNFPGLVGGGLQDNGNVYSRLDGLTPWKEIDGSDGGQMISLQPGNILHANIGGIPRYAVWDGVSLVDKGFVPVKDGTGKVIADQISEPVAAEIVNTPHYRNRFGQLMYAVGGGASGTFYGVFANSDGTDTHWEQIAKYPAPRGEVVSAIGSATGDRVLVAVGSSIGPHFFVVIPSQGFVLPVGPLPVATPIDGGIDRIVVQDDNLAYAVFGEFSVHGTLGQGAILRTRNGGASWEKLGGGLPNEVFYGMDTDSTTSPKTLYVDTDDRVYRSTDGGDTWLNVSTGLPRRPHGADLRFVIQADGIKYLYLATYGWSAWRALIS